MVKIWGRLSSVNVQKVVWCADELGLDYERIEAGGKFGVVDTPEYRAMNPNSKIPVIDHDGFVLWESNAIVRYLSSRFGAGNLYPDSLTLRADADRWMDWQATSFNPAMTPIFKQLIRTPAAERDAALMASSHAETQMKLALLDAHLADHEYVTGATFTMGDIPLACSVDRWMKLPCEKAAFKNVLRWYDTVRVRQGGRQVVALALS